MCWGCPKSIFFVNRQSKSWEYVKLVVDLNDDFKQHIPNYMYVYIYIHICKADLYISNGYMYIYIYIFIYLNSANLLTFPDMSLLQDESAARTLSRATLMPTGVSRM